MEHYKKAAEMGYADAQYVVGRCYENGLKGKSWFVTSQSLFS